MKKILKWINARLPVSKGTYIKDLQALWVVINGLKQSESQQAQIQMNLLKSISELQLKSTKNNNNNKINTAYQ